MRFLRVWPLVAVAGLWLPSTARSQVEISAGETRIRLGGRLHVQAATTECTRLPVDPGSPCTEEAPALDWFIRRARLTVEIAISERLDARIEPDFADVDAVELKDAWGRLTFGRGARLQIGHFKRPFDGFQLTSSTQILTIERDLDVPGVPGLVAASLDELATRFALSDRDIGLMLTGKAAGDRFHYWLGAFNGEGPTANGDVNSEKQLVARAAVSLKAGSLPLELAAAAAVTDRPFTTASGGTEGEYYENFELWAELGGFERGPHVQAGLVLGRNPLQNEAGAAVDIAAGEEFATMHAWQTILAFKAPLRGTGWVRAVEPLLRITRAEPNADVADDEVWGVTPGVQVFFTGRNKIALNWDFVSFARADTESVSSFKALYQFHF